MPVEEKDWVGRRAVSSTALRRHPLMTSMRWWLLFSKLLELMNMSINDMLSSIVFFFIDVASLVGRTMLDWILIHSDAIIVFDKFIAI